MQNYREQANQLAEQLTPSNKAYFEKVSSYLWFSGLFLNEEKLNEQVYQIVSDLLDAQHHGESAEQFFGKEPQAIADELIQATPASTLRDKVLLILEVAGIYGLFQLIGDFGSNSNVLINPLLYLVNVSLVVLLFTFLFSTLKRSIYSKKKLVYYGLAFLFIGAFLAWTLVGVDYFPEVAMINVVYPYDLFALGGGILLLVVLLAMKVFRELNFIGVLALLLVVGDFVNRCLLHFTDLSDKTLISISTIVTLVIYVLFILYTMKELKAGNKDDQ